MKHSLNTKVLVVLFFSILASCGPRTLENSLPTPDSTLKNSSSNLSQTTTPFNDPRMLINQLSRNGIGELKEWSNPFEMGWGSLTDYYPFGNHKDGIGMQNNIAYYLEGTESNVKVLTINLNINNPQEKKDALKFLIEVTRKTFNTIGLKMPHEIEAAILKSKGIQLDLEKYTISVELIKSKIETIKVNISRNES